MKVVISVCTFAAVALVAAGAPALGDGMVPDDTYVYYPHPSQYYRGRRSGYGAAYAPPCASAGHALAPAYIGPAHAGFGYGGGQAAYGYGGPHYRSEVGDTAAETEILNFSDMDQGMTEHMPMARYGGYGPAAASGAHAGAGLSAAGLGGAGAYGGQIAAAASGPAFAVFPGANGGGCNVPLLLSCSPSIVPGRLAKTQSSYGGGYGGAAIAAASAGNAYRGADDPHQELHEEHSAEMPAHDQLETTNEATHTGTHQ